MIVTSARRTGVSLPLRSVFFQPAVCGLSFFFAVPCGVAVHTCISSNVPLAKFYFAIYQTYILPMASGALADCKFLVCRRQMKRLPIASGLQVSRWPMANFIPDKRQIKILPSGNFLPAVRGLFFCQPRLRAYKTHKQSRRGLQRKRPYVQRKCRCPAHERCSVYTLRTFCLISTQVAPEPPSLMPGWPDFPRRLSYSIKLRTRSASTGSLPEWFPLP